MNTCLCGTFCFPCLYGRTRERAGLQGCVPATLMMALFPAILTGISYAWYFTAVGNEVVTAACITDFLLGTSNVDCSVNAAGQMDCTGENNIAEVWSNIGDAATGGEAACQPDLPVTCTPMDGDGCFPSPGGGTFTSKPGDCSVVQAACPPSGLESAETWSNVFATASSIYVCVFAGLNRRALQTTTGMKDEEYLNWLWYLPFTIGFCGACAQCAEARAIKARWIQNGMTPLVSSPLPLPARARRILSKEGARVCSQDAVGTWRLWLIRLLDRPDDSERRSQVFEKREGQACAWCREGLGTSVREIVSECMACTNNSIVREPAICSWRSFFLLLHYLHMQQQHAAHTLVVLPTTLHKMPTHPHWQS